MVFSVYLTYSRFNSQELQTCDIPVYNGWLFISSCSALLKMHTFNLLQKRSTWSERATVLSWIRVISWTRVAVVWKEETLKQFLW